MQQTGLSLIELMVAIAIGSVLMLGLTYTFQNSSDAERELERVGKMIENGRYASSLLTDNIHHAGYYGYYSDVSDAPAAVPDPCETTEADLKSNIEDALRMPLHGFAAPNFTTRADVSSTSCTGLLDDENLKPGSDILILRRADTATVDSDSYAIEASASQVELFINGVDAAPGFTADSVVRNYYVHVYFIAPCSFGAAADGTCTGAGPPDEDVVPTLKRLELSYSGGTTSMQVVPLIEGVEYMKIRYGIDTSPASPNAVTGFAGDGNPDSYVTSPTAAQWPLVVAVKLDLLLRAPERTPNFTDDKQYTLAGSSIGPSDFTADELSYKRRVFSAIVRPKNMAGRREIP